MPDRFNTMVVGVSGSDESLAAIAQARRLLPPDGRLVAVVVFEQRLAVQAGFDAAHVQAEIEQAAQAARDEAQALLADLPGGEVRLVQGRAGTCLLEIADETQADLLAVGSHEHSRVAGILLGSVATEVLHEASRSVLLARLRGRAFGTLVAGVDGSSQSLAALAVARAQAERLGARVRVIAAEGGKPLDLDGLVHVQGLEWDTRDPVTTLVAASEAADLVVVGSRGLHGLGSLGSVSERVAHQAHCSVLVVREPRGS
jgi:nucleotide-binding universal stress UspA family protein